MMAMIRKMRVGSQTSKLQAVTMRTFPMCSDKALGSPIPSAPNDANAFLMPMTVPRTPIMGVTRNNAPEHQMERSQNFLFPWSSIDDGGRAICAGAGRGEYVSMNEPWPSVPGFKENFQNMA